MASFSPYATETVYRPVSRTARRTFTASQWAAITDLIRDAERGSAPAGSQYAVVVDGETVRVCDTAAEAADRALDLKSLGERVTVERV